MITWKFGDDVVLLNVMPGGFYRGDITFYHTSSDCSGTRYLWNNGGVFAYYGQMSSGTVFYTRLADPLQPALYEVNSYEAVKPGDDLTATGSCTALAMGFVSVAPALAVTDPALGAFAAPFKLK